ncbi:hypothetical protein [Legionella maceachernii]|uniref:Coiled-coil protein n=1 Tax=Legionella maceachernii TaxID=466 RepID=A0A0W0VX90_9GAMM|nr:hypothetical protein [Legionella maceachernii]KTD24848.1 coiled-coil protein [Legionella maceachernii]SKA22596.1 SecA DEAD-like domain-containing protein [Legionella maceachernii]SUP01488.1 preprotein translocase subunit SecA [Legionella maceachernii]
MNPEQYTRLISDYLAGKTEENDIPLWIVKYNQAFKAATKYLEKNTRHDVFNLAAMGAGDEVTRNKQQANIALLHQFLDQTITNTDPPHFLEKAAPGIKAYLLDPALKAAEQPLYIYDAPDNLSIREKYARGLLTDKHWVTDLDLQRMLKLTDLSEKVKVMPLSVDSIGATLALAKQDIEAAKKDKLVYNENTGIYTIPLILNRPSSEKSGAAHWVAAQVYYHPVSGEISYQIDDSLGLSKEMEQEYKRIIEEAISYDDGFHRAFKGHPLVNEEGQHVPKCSITGHASQTDGYSCGYRALHSLLQNPDIRGENLAAEGYASIDASGADFSKALVKQFYQAQLKDLELPYDVYSVFARDEQFKPPVVSKPTIVRIDDEKLSEFLNELKPQVTAAPTTIDEAVSKGVGAYAPGQDLLSFPMGAKSEGLDAIQYEQYFSDITEAVHKTGIPVPVLLLTHSDSEALKGLNNFLAASETIPFNALQINIDLEKKDDVDLFVKNLQLALTNLSRHDLAKLQISDDQEVLTKEHYEQLRDFIAAEQIAVTIELPEAVKKTDLQRQIDSTTAINRRNKNSDFLKAALSKEAEVEQQRQARPIRARGKMTYTVSIDLEQSQNISETVVVSPTSIQQKEVKKYGGFAGLTVSDLREAIESKEDNAFAKFEKVAGGFKKTDFVQFWNTLSSNMAVGNLQLGQGKPAGKALPGMTHMGQVVHVNPQLDGFTDSALIHLVKYKEYFQDGNGINVDQLPRGFLLIPDPENAKAVLLHYDPTSDATSSLAPQFVVKPAIEAVGIDTADKLLSTAAAPESLKSLWKTLQGKEKYSRETSETFRQYLPQLLTLDGPQLETVMRLCGGVEGFNYTTLAFIFENLEQAKLSYADNYDEAHEKSLVSTEWMKAAFPELEDRKAFVTLANAIKPHGVAEHPLLTLLEVGAAPELREQMVQAIKDYQLTDNELNGLLAIHDKYGNGGLEKLLNKWKEINKIEPLTKLPALVKNTSAYEKLLVSDETLQAVQAISAFDKNKKQWWDKLYGAHVPQNDDFLSVYKSFNAFANAMDQYGLLFYDLSGKDSKSLFKGAGNLPATVGRMLSILNLCNADDRKLQWEAISEIDLSSKGALRAMTYAKAKDPDQACGFVVPEMALSPGGALAAKLYNHQIQWWHVSKAEPRDQAQIFYRFLAYQNDRYSLSFYNEAKAKIDKSSLSDKAKKQLAALLLASTTGDNHRFYAENPKTAMAYWDSILREIADVKAPIEKVREQVQEEAVRALYNLGDIPSLPVLERLVKLSMAPFHEIGSGDLAGAGLMKAFGGKSRLEKEADILKECNNRLKQLLKTYSNTIYLGMKFYGDADYKAQYDAVKKDEKEKPKEGRVNLFEHHLDVSEAIVKKDTEDQKTIGNILLEQISTFHLGIGDIDGLAKAIQFARGKKTDTRVYPQNHPLAGREIPATESQEIGVLRNGFFQPNSNYLVSLKARRSDALLHLVYLYPEDHPKNGQAIPETLAAEAKPVFLYPDEYPNKGEIIPENVDSSTIPNAVEGAILVYPNGERVPEFGIYKEGEPRPVLKQVFVYPEEHEQKGQIIPEGELVNVENHVEGWMYVYPEGHDLAGQKVAGLDIVKDQASVAQFKTVKLYPTAHPLKGQVIPTEEERVALPNAVAAWAYVYPEGHEHAGKRIEELGVAQDKEQLPPAPIFEVLREVYFYPKGHEKAGQQVPFDEKQPVGAILKVAYCYPDSHPDAGKIIEGKVFEVKKANAQYIFPDGERKGQVDYYIEGIELRQPETYPEGHPKAGQLCDFFMETGRDGTYKYSPFAEPLFDYALRFLKDIENPQKPEGKGSLTAEDLTQFLFAVSDRIEVMVPELERQQVITRERMNKELEPVLQENEKKRQEIEEELIKLRERLAEVAEKEPLDQDEIQKISLQMMDLSQKTPLDPVVNEPQLIKTVFTKEGKIFRDQLLDFVEERFGAHFAKDFFARQRAGEPAPEVRLVIDREFIDGNLKSLVESLRQYYDDPNNPATDKQIDLVLLLKAVCSGLSHTERLQLLQFLNQPRLKEGTKLDEFINLLKAINQNGSSSFIYFVQTAEKFEKPVTQLAEKATYFLTKALPQIRETEKKFNKAISEIDVVDLAIDVVLAANVGELTREIDINPVLTNAYSQLKVALDDSKPSVQAIDLAIRNLGIYVEVDKIEGMRELKDHLEWLQQPETEPYEITPASEKIERIPKKSTGGALAKGLGGLLGWKAMEDLGYEEKKVHIPAVMGVRPKVKTADSALLQRVAGVLGQREGEAKSYTYAFGETFSLIGRLVEKYSGAKSQILDHTRHYLSFNTADGSQIEEAFSNIGKLKREFEALEDQNLVIALCEHFGEVGSKESHFNYQHLLAIFKGAAPFENYPNLSPEAKKQILSVVVSLLNNDRPCELEDIKDLIDRCHNKETGELYQAMLGTVFQNAPFPSFDAMNGWFTHAVEQPPEPPKTFLDAIKEQYDGWSKEPVQREGINGFKLDEAVKQCGIKDVRAIKRCGIADDAVAKQLSAAVDDKNKIEGFKYKPEDLKALNEAVNGVTGVRHLSTKDLLAEIKAIRESSEEQQKNRKDPTRLVALMAELLYRTKGLEAVGAGKDREWGRSFEINTTQYLAIHSMLKAGGHVTSQIGTGEGKSRIMMISLACQYALGNTVDFVTADVSLATRDYLEFQAFFKSLGAETRLITADMPADQYQIGGIHFSDPTNLSLFRNRARSEGNWHKVIDTKHPEKRALMLDEADKIFFDCADTRNNYSAQANPNIRGMDWIYDLMVEFFSQEGNEHLYETDADKCNDAFIHFARGKLDAEGKEGQAKMARLVFNKNMPMPVVSRNQLEAWQNAALTALHLEYGKDFTIMEDISLQTKQGTKLVSQAQLRAGGRASAAAKFSFGVHQCLHARLNMVRENRLPKDPLANRGLDHLKYPFHIDPETQIVYSSTSKSLLDEYSEGELLAVTGTAGSIYERQEAMTAYGTKEAPMTFIDMPRHRGQKRVDNPVLLANTQQDHMHKILQAVLSGLDKNQPILLVCEDDNESARLHEFLSKNLSEDEKKKLYRVSAETKLEVEAAHIQNTAGQPGAITVSTAMLGRGTDIKLHGNAKDHGLKVVGTYLPRLRDYWQIVGRAGRFGAQGDSQLILDKERVEKVIKEYLGTETLPLEFYTATEDYLDQLQQRMDAYEQRVRLIKDVVNDFRYQLTKEFFDEFKASLPEDHDKDEVLGPWQQFVDKSDKLWNGILPDIQSDLRKDPVPIETLQENLAAYQRALQSEWTTMRAEFEAKFESGKIKAPEGKKLVADKLSPEVGALDINEKVRSLINPQEERRVLQTPIADKYDPAYVGRAVIYESKLDGLKAFFKNIAAAWRGDGPWFPNLKAWLNGNMSTSQFFFGSWGSPLVEKAAATTVTSENVEEAAPNKASANGSYRTFIGGGLVPEMLDVQKEGMDIVHQQVEEGEKRVDESQTKTVAIDSPTKTPDSPVVEGNTEDKSITSSIK